MGLACKNAILIVEFARETRIPRQGHRRGRAGGLPAAAAAHRDDFGGLHRRHDPLVLSHGAGAEVRSATGVTVFAGMIGVTLFGLFLTPVFYVGLRKLSGRELIQHGEASPLHG